MGQDAAHRQPSSDGSQCGLRPPGRGGSARGHLPTLVPHVVLTIKPRGRCTVGPKVTLATQSHVYKTTILSISPRPAISRLRLSSDRLTKRSVAEGSRLQAAAVAQARSGHHGDAPHGSEQQMLQPHFPDSLPTQFCNTGRYGHSCF